MYEFHIRTVRNISRCEIEFEKVQNFKCDIFQKFFFDNNFFIVTWLKNILFIAWSITPEK